MKVGFSNLRSTIAGLFMLTACGSVFGQAVVTSQFFGALPTGASQAFNIDLVLSNTSSNISGFNFRIYYDDTQLVLSGASNNTGQPAANAAYTIGPITAGTAGGNTNKFRTLLMVTDTDLVNPVTNLARLNLSTAVGYIPSTPIEGNFFVTDNGPGDGLFDGSFANISHTFYQGTPGLPVTVSAFELE